MRLLVSVRSATEAVAAQKSGADIVDAKEPSSGPLGPVAPGVLDAILRALPMTVPVGVALGDLTAPQSVPTALAHLPPAPRAATLFLKIGFGGTDSARRITAVLRCAAEVSAALASPAVVIAAAYADHDRAASAPPAVISESAAAAGVGGVLIDTWEKRGRGLLDCMSVAELRQWVDRMRSAGLLTALAGSLDADALARLAEAAPDVVGVRGAACTGGRNGRLDPARVRRLRALLDREPQPAL